MAVTPDELKKAALAERDSIEARVKGVQSGVSTYFDQLYFTLVSKLENTEALHGWDANLKPLADAKKEKAVAKLQWLESYLTRRGEGRLVAHDIRRTDDDVMRQSDIRSPERAMSQGTASCLTWKGSPLFKSVFDFAVLPMLLWELRPGSVFEIGSGTGASARWIADLIRIFGLKAQVYSADIAPVAESYEGVHFLAGDCRSPSTLFGADLLRSAPRPYLVLEDAHVNVREVCSHIDQFLFRGDYLFIEDCLSKEDDIKAFLGDRPQSYLVDTHYTDFFGRNATSAINSIFVKRG